MKITKLLLLFVAVAFVTACVPDYSQGSRAGVVTKFSRKGLVFKSWEGELNLGGFRNQTDVEGRSSVVANVFAFSVISQEIATQIEDALRSGKRVELVYRQWLVAPATQETCYAIVQVKPAS